MFTPIGFYAAQATGIITENLALYLDFKDGQSYDGTGVDVTDLSTNAFTLTGRNYNGGTITDSTLSFYDDLYVDLGKDGTVSNSDFIELSNNTGILPETGDYTMQQWIHLGGEWVYDQSKTEFISCIFEGTELVFTALRDFQSVGYPEIRWVVRDTNSNISSNNIRLDDYVTDNEWFLFTGTIDRTNNEQKVYINDTLVATGTTTFTGTISPNTDYAFGARPDTTAANDVGLFHGFVGKNMIYKGKALTAEEVATNYNNTKDEFINDGLPYSVRDFLFYYDAGQTTTFTDQSGNSNDGTETVIGSGGSSSITHNAGVAPYWQFLSPSPTVEKPFVQTATAAGNFGTDSWCQFAIVQLGNLTKNTTILDGRGTDATTQLLSLNTSRQNDEFFANLRGSDGTLQQLFSDGIVEDTWYFVIMQWDSVEGTIKYYINGIEGGDSSTTSENFNLDQAFKVGTNTLSSNADADSKIAAVGFAKSKALSFSERTELYNYYQPTYSLPELPPTEIFSDAQYWWRADLGVGTSGTTVTSWTDVINGFEMVTEGRTSPQLGTDSTLNNQSVIEFDGNDALYTLTTPASRTGDFTMFVVFNSTVDDEGNAIFGLSRRPAELATTFLMRATGGNFSNFTRRFDSNTGGFSSTIVAGADSTGAHTMFSRYIAADGQVNIALDSLTEVEGTGNGFTNQDWYAPDGKGMPIAAGAWVNNTIYESGEGLVYDNRYFNGSIAECVVVYGSPSSEELTAWKNYVNARYGTIIS